MSSSERLAVARRLCSSTERLLTAPAGFGLVTASPLQRAICRVIDGLPLGDLAALPELATALRCDPALLPTVKPHEFALLSGIRVGKSLMTAALAVRWSQTCDVSSLKLGPGEGPRISVVSLTKDLADVVHGHVTGRVMASPYLRELVIGDPVADAITLRHPSGMPVEIKVVAGSRAGASLVARWSAGCVMDEFSRMVGGSDGVVNWADSRNAILERLLPGACIAHIGSPWAPFGPAYDLIQTYWGKPTEDLVVMKTPAPTLNPYFWTPERVEAAQRRSEDVYRTDVLAEFATPEESLFASGDIERATRAEPGDLAPEWGADYCAALDPATRGNGWSLVVMTRKGTKRRVALVREWVGSASVPLSPKAVLGEIAGILKGYGITSAKTDQYHFDSLRELASDVGVSLLQTSWTDKERTEIYFAFRARLTEGCIELHQDPVLRSDLQRVVKRVTQGGVQVVLPRTSDGRHCDTVPALMLAASRYLDDVELPPAEQDSERAHREEQARMRKLAERQHKGRRGLWG